MRKITVFFLLTFLSLCSFAELIVVPTATNIAPVSIVNVAPKNSNLVEYISNLSPNEFLKLNPKQIKKQTGTKLSLTQKIALKIAQKHVRKQIKRGDDIDMRQAGADTKSGVDALWLILGIFLGLIAVIIALVTKKDKDDNRVKSALIGWAIWLVLLLLLI
jgi:hypothetical protein